MEQPEAIIKEELAGESDENGIDPAFAEIDQLIRDSEREYETRTQLSRETRERLKGEAVELVERLITEQGEGKANGVARLLARLYAHPGLSQENPLNGEVKKLFAKMDWGKWGVEQEGYGAGAREDVVTQRANLLSREIFIHYGLDPTETATAWRDSVFPMEDKGEKNIPPEKQQELIVRNLDTLQALELKRHGGASFLARKFNLRDLGRYPLSLLINQYDEADDLEHPYGIIVTARRDYNGALYQERGDYEDLLGQLYGKYRIRAMEIGGRFGVVRSLIRLDRQYGERQKVSFAIVNGHGSAEKLAFGDWSTGLPAASIAPSDIVKGRGLERIKDFFTKRATIIIDSCEVGEKGGLGQLIFERLGMRVITFDKFSRGISSIKAKIKDDGIDFAVKFLKPGFFLTRKAREYG